MNEPKIYNTISQLEGVTNFHERQITNQTEDITHFDYAFEFSNYKFLGTQVKSSLFTLNRFNLLFRYILKKDTTRLNVLETINQYNAERPLLKVCLSNMSGKNVEVTFSSDFISDDDKIVADQLIPLINIVASSPGDFVQYLNKKKIFLNDK